LCTHKIKARLVAFFLFFNPRVLQSTNSADKRLIGTRNPFAKKATAVTSIRPSRQSDYGTSCCLPRLSWEMPTRFVSSFVHNSCLKPELVERPECILTGCLGNYELQLNDHQTTRQNLVGNGKFDAQARSGFGAKRRATPSTEKGEGGGHSGREAFISRQFSFLPLLHRITISSTTRM
jgi:hypothetical protein